tara:strand:+ start:770 stop:1096 length:327 start_codon:yes stop_codon:yes gene_type:complete
MEILLMLMEILLMLMEILLMLIEILLMLNGKNINVDGKEENRYLKFKYIKCIKCCISVIFVIIAQRDFAICAGMKVEKSRATRSQKTNYVMKNRETLMMKQQLIILPN